MRSVSNLLGSLLIGLVLAGPAAAAAVAIVPEQWRGPAIPWGIAVSAVGLVLYLRRPQKPPE